METLERPHLRAWTTNVGSLQRKRENRQPALSQLQPRIFRRPNSSPQAQNVRSLHQPRPAALPPRLHGLLHSPNLQRWLPPRLLPSLNNPPPLASLTKECPARSASATRGAPTARTSSTSWARRTRSRPARRRSSRASSRCRTRTAAGWPSGSASTATCPGCTPSRSRGSFPTRSGRSSRMSIVYTTSRTFLPLSGNCSLRLIADGLFCSRDGSATEADA